MINRELPIVFRLDGTDYPFHSDFREWIRFESLVNNSDVPEIVKGTLMRNLVFAGKPPANDLAADSFIAWFYNGGHEIRKSSDGEEYLESRRVYDFEYDFDYIYAAFMELYRTDLVDIPYLHWWKFRALFKGLHDCRMTDIMGYRGAEITDDMPKSRQAFLMDMQELYELPISLAEQRRKEEIQRFLNG
ncbi:MAG: bacteriophage Gp15 family protein [Oscillospiraceae bacterium]|nr:bacteriophage Gp15 family protein [Oscillospiraceae bacterium]